MSYHTKLMRIHARSCLLILIFMWLFVGFACDQGARTDTSETRVLNLTDGGLDAEQFRGDMGVWEARLNSIRPGFVPISGGTVLTVIGVAFDAAMEIRVDGILCGDLVIVSSFRATCVVPQVEAPGPAVLHVLWSDGYDELHPDVLTYYTSLEVLSVDPDVLKASQGGEVVLTGRGFVNEMNLAIGGLRLPLRLQEDGTAMVRIPRMEPGRYPLDVSTPFQAVRNAVSLTLVSPIQLSEVAPPVGTVRGGESIRLSGIGLEADSQVRFGSLLAEVTSSRADGTGVFVEAPVAGTLGFVDVSVENINGRTVLEDAYLYTPSGSGGFRVDGVLPERVPITGGQGFWIGGVGFTSDVTVYLNERQLLGCITETANRIFCAPESRAAGVYQVSVKSSDGIVSASFDVTYFDEPLIFSILPSRGSVAGGTLVELLGRGFDSNVSLWMDSEPVLIFSVTDERIIGLTPASAEGLSDLRLIQGDTDTVVPDMYEYLDLGSPYGGVWGPEINRNVNVSVYDSDTRRPVARARIRVESVLDGRVWQAQTNAVGQVVVADPLLSPPLRIMAGHPNYTSSSVDRLVSENVSLLLINKVPPEGDGMPESDPLVTVSGTVVGINTLQKPEDLGLTTIALVESSHAYPNGRFATPMPSETSILLEDGPYEMTVLPGQFGLFVNVGFVPTESLTAYQAGENNYWALRKALQPRAMGYKPFLVGYPGDEITGVDLTVDRPRQTTVEVRLENPPGGGGQAPNEYLARGVLSLGADGYLDLGVEMRGDTPEFTIYGLPQIDDWPEAHVKIRWEGEAFTVPGDMILNNRYSFSSVTEANLNPQVRIGPFLPTTEVVDPLYDAVVTPPLRVRWNEHAGLDADAVQEVADLHYLSLSNQDGLLWTGWLPGALTEFVPPIHVPPLSDQVGALNAYYLSVFSVLVDSRFTFDDFRFNGLGDLRAYSWSFTRFSDGELPTSDAPDEMN